MANDIYWDFAHSVRGRLKEEVNGMIKFEIYGSIDTVIFKIYFKKFEFHYAINEVQSVIYEGRTEEVVDDILHRYRKTILNAFFKSDERKRKEQEECV